MVLPSSSWVENSRHTHERRAALSDPEDAWSHRQQQEQTDTCAPSVLPAPALTHARNSSRQPRNTMCLRSASCTVARGLLPQPEQTAAPHNHGQLLPPRPRPRAIAQGRASRRRAQERWGHLNSRKKLDP